MVLPGGSDISVPLAIAPDDLRQLADHDAEHRMFDGDAGPLVGLDTGGSASRGTALLVAGYTGSKEDFAPVLRPLSDAGFRVVAIDQRGQYESPGPDDPARYTVDELGADVVLVARALREESGEPLHLVGHSFGGIVCRAAVLQAADVFTSFTLLGSGPAELTGRRAELLDHLGPLLDTGGVEMVNAALEQVAMTDPRAQAVPPPTRKFLSKRFLRNAEAGLRGMAAAMLSEPDRVAELKAVGIPSLVTHGEADDAWMPHVQAEMARRLGARYEVIENSIHSPAVENPVRMVAVLLDFWADVVEARR